MRLWLTARGLTYSRSAREDFARAHPALFGYAYGVTLRGYDLCSSGTVASITAFMTSALQATGWNKVAANARCFYADQCWTRDLTVISWHVDDPLNWHIAYRPATS